MSEIRIVYDAYGSLTKINKIYRKVDFVVVKKKTVDQIPFHVLSTTLLNEKEIIITKLLTFSIS